MRFSLQLTACLIFGVLRDARQDDDRSDDQRQNRGDSADRSKLEAQSHKQLPVVSGQLPVVSG